MLSRFVFVFFHREYEILFVLELSNIFFIEIPAIG